MLGTLLLTVTATAVAPQNPPLPKPISRFIARAQPAARPVAPPVALAATGVPEREYNGSRGFADPIVPGTVVGTLTDSGDLDYYRLELGAPGILTVSTAPDGATPVQSASVVVFDADRMCVAWGLEATFPGGFASAKAAVPAGTYFIECRTRQSNGGGGYSLTVGTSPLSGISTLPTNGTVQGSLAVGATDTWVLTVPVDSNVQIQGAGGPLDLFFDLRRITVGWHFCVDDSIGSTDPFLDIDVPAGSYLLLVNDNAASPGNYTLQVTQTPRAIPTLGCGSLVSGSLPDEGSFRLYRLPLSTAQSVLLTTSGTGSTPMQDGFLTVYDQRLVPIAYADEHTTSSNPIMSLPLPASAYFVGVYGFDGVSANFDLNVQCSPLAPLPALLPGRRSGVLPGTGPYAAWELLVRTPAPFDVTLRGTGVSALHDGMLSVIDAQTGEQVDFDDDSFGLDPHVGAMLDPGRYWVIARDYNNETGTFDLTTEAPLRYLDPNGPRTLLGLAKRGDLLAAWVSAFEVAPTPVLPGLLDGFLQIDLGSAVLAHAQIVPVDGRTTGPTLPTGFTYFTQGAVFPNAALPADLTNLLR